MQVRWATVLYRMVARMKSKVSITVAWRPLYECVRQAYMQPLNTYTGKLQFSSKHPPLAAVCCRLSHTSLKYTSTPSLNGSQAVRLISLVYTQITQALPPWQHRRQRRVIMLTPAGGWQLSSRDCADTSLIARCHLACRAFHSGEPQGGLHEAHPGPASLLRTWGSGRDMGVLQTQAADHAPRLPGGKHYPARTLTKTQVQSRWRLHRSFRTNRVPLPASNVILAGAGYLEYRCATVCQPWLRLSCAH